MQIRETLNENKQVQNFIENWQIANEIENYKESNAKFKEDFNRFLNESNFSEVTKKIFLIN